MAFALHQIIVVSGVEITHPSWMAPYLQTLDRNAFGNYRQLLYEITLNPAMGNYLDVNGKQRARGPTKTTRAKCCSCFRSGRNQLNQDGTPQLDENGQTSPRIRPERPSMTFARVFTGWRLCVRAAHRRRRTTSIRWSPTRPSTTSQPKRC